MKSVPLHTLLTMSLLLASCGRNPIAPATQSLVIDPVPVARSLGRDADMQRELDVRIAELNTRLNREATELNARLEQEKAKLGSKPGEDALRAFRESSDAASQSLQKSQLAARQQIASYRSTLIGQFNDELRQIAGEIASGRGASSVVIVTDNVLWFDPAADITAEVIEKLRAREQTTPPAPAGTTGGAAAPQELRNLESVIKSIEKQESAGPPRSP